MQTATLRPNPTFLSIAKMAIEDNDFVAMGLDALASQYPELDFVFDKVKALGEELDEIHGTELSQRWDIEDEVGQLKDSMKDAADQVRRVIENLSDTVAVSELEVALTWLNTE